MRGGTDQKVRRVHEENALDMGYQSTASQSTAHASCGTTTGSDTTGKVPTERPKQQRLVPPVALWLQRHRMRPVDDKDNVCKPQNRARNKLREQSEAAMDGVTNHLDRRDSEKQQGPRTSGRLTISSRSRGRAEASASHVNGHQHPQRLTYHANQPRKQLSKTHKHSCYF